MLELPFIDKVQGVNIRLRRREDADHKKKNLEENMDL